MSEHNLEALMQGIFNAGSYQAGQKFILEHREEISSEFVSALRATSMNLLEGERSAPELAQVFAELAMVAAIALNDDNEKGMSRYCEGSVLARLGQYDDATSRYEEAKAYLHLAKNFQQLANCLYDYARCYEKLGHLSQAINLLEKSLSYESDQEERAKTLALMFHLESQLGQFTNSEDEEHFLIRVGILSYKRKLHFRETDNIKEKELICKGLANHHTLLIGQAVFENSIPYYLTNPDYVFFVCEDTSESFYTWPPYSYGLLKKYRDTFNERDLLGLEAAYYADSDSRSHLEIIESLKKLTQECNIPVLCIPEKSFSHVASFITLLRQLDKPLSSIPMQGAQPRIYSAFTESPDARLFFASCLCIDVQLEQWDFEGKRVTEMISLYRGEGRLECRSKHQQWQVSNFAELRNYFFKHGFRSQVPGSFLGTIQAQLRHQGYVKQPTISLSESFSVGAYYATNKHTRLSGGLVFRVDTAELLRHGAIYDSLGTLKKASPWVLERFYSLIKRIMRVLDNGRNDVRNSGAFLEQCRMMSRRRVESFGGGQTFGPQVDWLSFFNTDTLTALEENQISVGELNLMMEEFEMFWGVALGHVISNLTIDAITGSSKTSRLSPTYFKAFDEVRLELKEQWILNQYSDNNHPGWDLSPYGYITKSIRDNEFFSDGNVPGYCILEATEVDQTGQSKGNTIYNPWANTA